MSDLQNRYYFKKYKKYKNKYLSFTGGTQYKFPPSTVKTHLTPDEVEKEKEEEKLPPDPRQWAPWDIVKWVRMNSNLLYDGKDRKGICSNQAENFETQDIWGIDLVDLPEKQLRQKLKEIGLRHFCAKGFAKEFIKLSRPKPEPGFFKKYHDIEYDEHVREQAPGYNRGQYNPYEEAGLE